VLSVVFSSGVVIHFSPSTILTFQDNLSRWSIAFSIKL